MDKNMLVFDVESTSLMGSGFAFGAIVISPEGEIVDEIELLSEEGKAKADEWVKTNVIPSLDGMTTVETDKELREKFWEFYEKHKETSQIWGDVIFPVETNFLTDVAKDDLKNRAFNMPYPLLDIVNFIHPNYNRAELSKIEGLRPHNPLDDAKASAFAYLNHN